MCYACWERKGAPRITNASVYAIVAALENADTFGALHIVVDDENVEDENLDWCKEYAGKHASKPWTYEDEVCYQAMKAATLDERVSAMALWNGYYSEP